MERKKKKHFSIIRLLIKIGVFCLMAMVIITLGVSFFLNSQQGNKFLSSYVNESLYKALDCNADIEGIRINFPLKIQIKLLQLSDNKGIWLKAENNEINISLLALLKGQLAINDLSSDSLDLISMPEAGKERAQDSDPNFRGIVIDNISIERLSLGKDVTGLRGNLSASVKGRISLEGQEQKLRFLLVSGQIKGSSNQALEEIKIQAKGHYLITDDTLVLEELTGESGIWEIKGESTIEFTHQKIEGKYSFLFRNLNKVNPGLDPNSRLKGSLTLSGILTTPSIAVNFSTENIKYKTNPYPDAEGRIEAALESDLGRGTIFASTIPKNIAFQTNFTFRKDGTINFEDALAQGERLSISSKNLKYNFTDNLVAGKLEIKNTDLSWLSFFSPLLLSGMMRGTIELTTSTGRQECRVIGDIEALSVGEELIEAVHMSLDIKDVWKLHVENASIELIKPHFAQNLWDNLRLKAGARDTKWEINIAGTSENKEHSFDISTILSFSYMAGGKFEGVLSSLKGHYGSNKIIINRAATMKYEPGKLLWEVAEIRIGDRGVIRCNGALQDDNVRSEFYLKEVPFFGYPYGQHHLLKNSKINGEGKMCGSVSMPDIESRFKLTDLQPSNAPLLSEISLSALLRKNNLKVKAQVKGDTATKGMAEINLPISFSLVPLSFKEIGEQDMGGKITLRLPLDLLAGTFLPVSHKLGGLLVVNLSLKGTLHTPLIQGKVELSNGKYTFYPLGIKLKNINGNLKAHNSSLSLDGATAYDNQGNKLEARGKLELSLPYAFKFSLSTKDFNLLNHQSAHGKVKVDLAIEGDSRGAEISGSVEPHSFEINLPEQFTTTVQELNIVATVPSENEEKYHFTKSDSSYSIFLNALVHAGKQVFVRGWGLNSELGGSLKVKGSISQPELKGKLYTIRGRYEEFGEQFQIKESILAFEGTIPPSPYLYIKGASTVENIEIRLVLSGPLLAPSLSIESTPALPQEEALSRLLFGKEAKNISPFQAIQLANSLRRLGGYGKKGFDPLDSARSLLYVNDIKIKTGADSQESTLGVGKYLTDKVYIEFERGIQSGTRRTNLQVELTPNILLESSMGGTGSSSVGINWKRDY